MQFPPDIPVYGNPEYRGQCPMEALEQVTFFNRLRREYPSSWGLLALHPRNEGRRNHMQVAKERAEGMTVGAVDIIVPGSPAFVCELKRRDHTKCNLSPEQAAYLTAAKEAGAFTCIALGVDAAWEAFNVYLASRA